MVLERRREFALLRAVGADTTQLLTSPAEEGAIAALGSVLIGVPVGVALGALAVRVLQLFFTLPPPVATVPAGTLAALVVGVAAASALALGAALVSVTRVTAARCGSLTAQPPP
jgi:putative ABC transport system permease protein